MRRFCTAALCAIGLVGFAQDTLTVRTFTFDSITTRRGTWLFPDTSHHYRKVLMLHTLKCDAATTQDEYPCGAWDYLTYNRVYEHTGIPDSTALTHGRYRINAEEPDSTALSTLPLYDHHQRYERFRVVDAAGTGIDHPIGVNDASDALTLDASSGEARTQFLLTADALTGLDQVDAIRLFAQQAGSALDRLIIRLKNTAATELTAMDTVGLTVVYDRATQLTAGINTFTLLEPFTWAGAGTSILVDIAVQDRSPGSAPVLNATTTATPVLHAQRDGHLAFTDGRVGIDGSLFAGVQNAITVTFRVFGSASLPQNTSAFEALDAQGQRVLNVHLPWSDGTVYWDAGSNGYDRISKPAIVTQYEGRWNYWAFTKNAVTGSMKIYLNGSLWQSGTGKTKPMTGITVFNIGSNGEAGYPYPGMMDDFNVFATELDAATIHAWMGERVDSSHPAYADLLVGLPFDDGETAFTARNLAANGVSGHVLGRTAHRYTPATALTKLTGSTTVRPDLVLVQADQTSHIDSSLVTEAVIHPGISLETFAVAGNAAVPQDTLNGWEGGMETTYAPGGEAIDSSPVNGSYVVNDTLNYFSPPFERVNEHEIGRYITPYGINLTLGANGFTWVYDVTDYQYLLHDSVDLSAGNQQELLDLRFLMIEGVPGRKVIAVQEPWGPQQSFSYGDLSSDAALSAVDLALNADAHQWALRSRITGHGDASSNQQQGCCEFKDNTHSLSVGGTAIDSWHVWQTHDCALNPLYPQGGTWLDNREGWCPGDVVKERTTELTPYVSGGTLDLDYGITPVPADNPGMAEGNYQMSMELFEFSAPTHALDAEVYDVLRPTDDRYRARENPVCDNPAVVLRNAGGEPLTSVTFTYGVSGGTPQEYTWTGNLPHMARTTVMLPIPNGDLWTGDQQHRFTVSVHSPNGGTDEYADNDSYSTHFELPVVYPTNVILYYKTNNRPQENELTVTDVSGTVVHACTDMAANTTYRDTLQLVPGCYTLHFTDSSDNGLYYWADPAQGSGYLSIRSLSNLELKNFISEFGRSIDFAFAIGSINNVDELVQRPGLEALPNPSDGRFSLRTTNAFGPLHITVYDATGKAVKVFTATAQGGAIAMDLSDMAAGPYMVRMTTANGVATTRVIVQ